MGTSRKRRNTSSPESDHLPLSKRPRQSPSSPEASDLYDEEEEEEEDDDENNYPVGAEQPRADPVYGQHGAFPGLGDGDFGDDELFYGQPEDGLEYLRMVR